jgi:hypothetical protein
MIADPERKPHQDDGDNDTIGGLRAARGLLLAGATR